MISPQNYRLRWLDYSRGIAIVLVAYAHVRNSLVNNGVLQDAERLLQYDRIVTAGLMPVFFVMSGMFVQSALRQPVAAFTQDKLRTLVYPYVMWSLLYFFLNWALGNHHPEPHHLQDLWTLAYSPRAHMWYLYALFGLMMLYLLAARLGLSPASILAIGVGVLLARSFGFETGGGRVIEAIQVFLPYFALGALVNRRGPAIALSEAPTATLLGIVAGGYAIAWLAFRAGWLDSDALRLAVVLPSALAILSIAVLLERAGRAARWIALLGGYSVQIYLAHVLAYSAMRVLLQEVLGIENLALHVVLDGAAALLGPVLLAVVAQRLGIPYLFSLRGFRFRRIEPVEELASASR